MSVAGAPAAQVSSTASMLAEQRSLKHRQLAEDRTRPEGRQGDRASVRVQADHPAAARVDDVAGVAGSTVVKDPGVAGIPARDRHLREPRLQLLRREL